MVNDEDDHFLHLTQLNLSPYRYRLVVGHKPPILGFFWLLAYPCSCRKDMQAVTERLLRYLEIRRGLADRRVRAWLAQQDQCVRRAALRHNKGHIARCA